MVFRASIPSSKNEVMASGKLTAIAVKTLACPEGKKFARFSDGGGLYLEVMANGSKFWRGKYRVAGVERRASLGRYPLISLQMARARWQAFKLELTTVADPVKKALAEATAALTVREIAEAMIAVKRSEWVETHAARTERILEKSIYPKIGRLPLASISTPELIQLLQPLADKGQLSTLGKTASILSLIWQHARHKGTVKVNAAADLVGAFQTKAVKHFAGTTDPQTLGHVLRCIDRSTATPSIKHALTIAPHLFKRPAELYAATWSEFDLEAKLWRLPIVRTKTSHTKRLKGGHQDIPLTEPVLEILRLQLELTGGEGFVFPSLNNPAVHISENAMRGALISAGISPSTQTVHGFRATARTLIAENLGIPTVLIERQLGHVTQENLGEAYDRSSYLSARRDMLDRWSAHLIDLKRGGEVVPLHAVKAA